MNSHSFDQLVMSLNEPTVRRLASTVFAPPLFFQLNDEFSAPQFELNDARIAWLKHLDQSPEDLHLHLKQAPSLRLGIYHEWLWLYFLLHDCEVNFIAHNSAVRHHGDTLGAFDFLYTEKEHPDTLIHLEVATKYYLGIKQPSTSWRHWWGANTNDYLERKLQRLLTHQITLSETSTALSSHPVIAPWAASSRSIEKRIHVGGRLFYPCNDLGDTYAIQHSYDMDSPMQASRNHMRGLWVSASEWQRQVNRGYIEYRTLSNIKDNKANWLDPHFESLKNISAMNNGYLATNHKPPQLVAAKIRPLKRKSESKTKQISTLQKANNWHAIFIVNDEWQQDALHICSELPAL